MAQKVSVILCGSSDTDTKFWKIDGKRGNSVLAYNQEHDVGLLMISNDKQWNSHFNLTAELLRSIWMPTLIVLGDLNGSGAHLKSDERAPEFKDAFPGVPLIACSGRGLPSNCGALGHKQNGGFGDCREHASQGICGSRGQDHECVPGKQLRYRSCTRCAPPTRLRIADSWQLLTLFLVLWSTRTLYNHDNDATHSTCLIIQRIYTSYMQARSIAMLNTWRVFGLVR